MKRIISNIFVVLLIVFITACGSNKNEFVVATNATFPPYEYKDGNEYRGIDIEIAKEIANSLGKDLRVLDIEFNSIIPAVVSGKADIALAGMTVTDEREESLNFSIPYTYAVQAIVVKNNSGIYSVDDLTNKIIGVQTGTTGDMYCTDDFGEANIKRFNVATDTVQALISDIVDCVVIDDQVAKAMVSDKTDLRILNSAYTEEEYAIGINKNNTELLETVNSILSEMKANGRLQEIINEYIY